MEHIYNILLYYDAQTRMKWYACIKPIVFNLFQNMPTGAKQANATIGKLCVMSSVPTLVSTTYYLFTIDILHISLTA